MKTIRNIKIWIINTLLIFMLFSKVNTFGQISKKIDSLASSHFNNGFNGNILYSKNDSIVFTGNYGYKNILKKDPLNNNTLFELASISKQFTALAIVQLKEKKLLKYDDAVYKFIKSFPYKNITIRHLLKHQSGLPDYQKILYNKKTWNRKKVATNKDIILLLKKRQPKLLSIPGTKYDYNNTGYALLASIIETVSKQSYATYIEQHIFIPSKMQGAFVFKNSKEIKTHFNLARGYTYNKKKKKYQKIEKDKTHKHIHWMNGIVGDRGIYASIIDLKKWNRALKENFLISEDGKKEMFKIDNISKKYGFGFAIYQTKDMGRWVYHNGSWSGYKTSAIYLPKSNQYLVILSNNRYQETYNKFELAFYNLIKNN